MEKERTQKNKTKGNGEGTIYKVKRTGLLSGQYVVNGERKTIYQKKHEKVGDFKNRFNNILSTIYTGTYISENNISLYKILNEYIENKYKTGITSEATYKRDTDYLKFLERACSSFIYSPIQKVTIYNIKKCLPNFVEVKNIDKDNNETIKYYSQSIIDKTFRLLNKGFKIATSEKIILYNIMDTDNIKKPKSKKESEKVIALSIEEEKKLIELLKSSDHKYKNIVLLTLFTGLRIGETLALKKEDINLKEKTITIRRTLTRNKNDEVILNNRTKTKNSQRTIYLNQDILNLLKKVLNNKITNIYNLIFYDYKKNTFITPSEINCYLIRLNNKYKFCKNIHTHMLRHTYATRCIEAGMSAKVLQKNLGHSKIQTTLDTYTDVFEKFNKDENEKYNNYMKSLGI